MQKILVLALSLLASPMALAFDPAMDHPGLEKFRARCRYVRRHWSLDPGPSLAEGALGFFPLGAFESAQARFSYSRLRETVAEAKRQMTKVIQVDRKGRNRVAYLLAADNHHAAFGLDRPALGVFYRGKIYLNDGNHKAIASHLLGAVTMAVKIIKVWDDQDDFETFRAGMEGLNLGHWQDYNGEMMPFLDLCDLVNDPNLYLARLQIRRATVDFEGETPVLRSWKGAKRASAIKINQQAMIEMHWSDSLHRAGRKWSDLWGVDQLSYAAQKQDLKIVKAAALDEGSPLKDVLLLDHPRKKPEMDALIAAHVETFGCERFLRHGVAE